MKCSMYRFSSAALWLPGVLVALFTGSATAAPFQNGSFETNTGSAAAGWSNTGPIVFTSDEGATDGTQSAIFNGANQVPSAVVWQTFDTIPSQNYFLDFDFGKYAAGSPDTIIQQLQIEVRDGASPSSGGQLIVAGSGTTNGASGGTIFSNTSTPQVRDSSGAVINSLQFSHFTFQFIATSGTSTLVFRDQADGTVNTDGALDSVAVTVPEPASLTAFAAAGLALMRRRRHTE